MAVTPTRDPNFPPLDHVAASRQDGVLQRRWRVRVNQARAEGGNLVCPACGAVADELAWFYFRSPPWTWEHLCGCEGVVVYCDHCNGVVAYGWDVIN